MEKMRRKMTKQATGKRDDSPFHAAVRAGDKELAMEIIEECKGEMELKEMLSKQTQSGETALYVAAENGYIDLTKELIQFYDTSMAYFKARNGYDAFHIAAKRADLEIVKVLIEANLQKDSTMPSTPPQSSLYLLQLLLLLPYTKVPGHYVKIQDNP